ncbi:MAG: M20 family metallopeptidase [Moorellales bacterium]
MPSRVRDQIFLGGVNLESWVRAKLRELVAIPSETGQEAALLRYLEEELARYGIPWARQPVNGDRYNLLLNPQPEPRLLIDVHVDTVPIRLEGITCPLREEEDVVYGRGACDAKGSLAAVLAAVHWWLDRPSPPPLPVTVAFTVDEENAGLGSEVLAQALKPRAALVMEPTELAVCVAQAGSLVVRLAARGLAVHGSEFEQGQNACSKLLNALARLSSLSFLGREHPRLGRADYNLRYLHGGAPELVVPAHCEAVVDFRLLPSMDLAAVQQEVEAFWKAAELEGEIVEVAPPYEISPEEPVVKLLGAAMRRALEREPEIAGIKSWTDAENYHAVGVPAAVWGPGRLAVAHTPREHIRISELADAAGVLITLLGELG